MKLFIGIVIVLILMFIILKSYTIKQCSSCEKEPFTTSKSNCTAFQRTKFLGTDFDSTDPKRRIKRGGETPSTFEVSSINDGTKKYYCLGGVLNCGNDSSKNNNYHLTYVDTIDNVSTMEEFSLQIKDIWERSESSGNTKYKDPTKKYVNGIGIDETKLQTLEDNIINVTETSTQSEHIRAIRSAQFLIEKNTTKYTDNFISEINSILRNYNNNQRSGMEKITYSDKCYKDINTYGDINTSTPVMCMNTIINTTDKTIQMSNDLSTSDRTLIQKKDELAFKEIGNTIKSINVSTENGFIYNNTPDFLPYYKSDLIGDYIKIFDKDNTNYGYFNSCNLIDKELVDKTQCLLSQDDNFCGNLKSIINYIISKYPRCTIEEQQTNNEEYCKIRIENLFSRTDVSINSVYTDGIPDGTGLNEQKVRQEPYKFLIEIISKLNDIKNLAELNKQEKDFIDKILKNVRDTIKVTDTDREIIKTKISRIFNNTYDLNYDLKTNNRSSTTGNRPRYNSEVLNTYIAQIHADTSLTNEQKLRQIEGIISILSENEYEDSTGYESSVDPFNLSGLMKLFKPYLKNESETEVSEKYKNDKIKCIAHFGTNIGDPLCCNQSGVLQNTKFVCPSNRPTCANFKCGSDFGNCID